MLVISGLILSLSACSRTTRRMAQADKLERAGKYADALAVYSEVLRQHDGNGDAMRSAIELRAGECLWRLGRGQEAFESMQAAVLDDPQNRGARARLAALLLAGGLPARALEEANRVLAAEANNAEALTVLGAIYASAGRDEDARQAFTRALEAEPNRVAVSLALAELYSGGGNLSEAQRVLLRSAAAAPRDASPLLALGRMEEQAGDQAAAEIAYRRAIAAQDDATSNLRYAQFLQRTSRLAEAEVALRRADAHPAAHSTFLADAFLISGQALRALQEYTSLLARSSAVTMQRDAARDPSAALGPLAARLIEADLEAGRSREENQRPSSVVLARQHLEEHRGELDPAAQALLEAEISMEEGELGKAAQKAELALQLAPQSAAAHYVSGAVMRRRAEPVPAQRQWELALQADPSYAPAHLALAAEALDQADAGTAEQHVIAVVRDEPGNLRALVLYARALAQQGKLDAAEAVAQRALALDGSTPAPHIVLGEIASRKGRASIALAEYQRALAIDPDSSAAIGGLTDVYRRGRISRPMLQKMEAIAAAPPESATLMEILGRLYAQRGWKEDARRCLERAMKMDAHRASAALALSGLFNGSPDEQRNAAAAMASASGPEGAGAPAMLAALGLQRERQADAAIRQYEIAIRQGEVSGVAANNLAWLYAEKGIQLERALALARSAQQQSPRNPAVLDTLGFVLLKRREYSEALQVLQQAAELTSNASAPRISSAEALELRGHLAQAYLLAGQPDAAAAVGARR